MIYRIFWSVPSEEFFNVMPEVQEVVDSVRFYEPMKLFNPEPFSHQNTIDFPKSDESIFDSYNVSEFGLSFKYRKGWEVISSISDTGNLSPMKKGSIAFSNLPEGITMELDLLTYEILDITQRNETFCENVTALFTLLDCPECLLDQYKPGSVSGESAKKATVYLEKNDGKYIEEKWVVCPVFKHKFVSRYKIVYSVPNDNWERIQPFMQDFMNSIKIYEPC